jgi:hypothetical protein
MSARYRILSPAEEAALSPSEMEVYRAERATFAAEVERHRRHLHEHGWLDLTPGSDSAGTGRRFYLRCMRLYGTRACLRRRRHQGPHSPKWEGPPVDP